MTLPGNLVCKGDPECVAEEEELLLHTARPNTPYKLTFETTFTEGTQSY